MKKTIGEIVTDYTREHGISDRELSRRSGLTPAYIGQVKRGMLKNPTAASIEKLARGMNVTSRQLISMMNDSGNSKVYQIPGFARIPLFSGLSCGTGELVDDQADEYLPIPDSWTHPGESYFANIADGDSMVGKGIYNGNILVFQKTDHLDNGDIGSFFFDDAFYCKTYRRLNERTVLLESANDTYDPILVDLKEHPEFRILGRLTAQMISR